MCAVENEQSIILSMEVLPYTFNIYRLRDFKEIPLDHPFVFLANTDEERSAVCPDHLKLTCVTAQETGYKGLRIRGILDFSLTGILSAVTSILSQAKIPVFALSTFNTDYIFVKTEKLNETLNALTAAGCLIHETAE